MGSRLIWDPVPKNGSIASLEQDAHSAPQVGGSFPLILASVAGKSRSQLLHLPLGIWVPSPPKVSATIGKKAIPCLLHSSTAPFIFRSYA